MIFCFAACYKNQKQESKTRIKNKNQKQESKELLVEPEMKLIDFDHKIRYPELQFSQKLYYRYDYICSLALSVVF